MFLHYLQNFISDHTKIWLIVGFMGQFLFFMRFFVQWLASERAKKSVVPVAFWYFSVMGGAVLFIYALWRQDPVFIAGQGAGLIIYARNLYLIHAEKKISNESAAAK